VQLLGDLPEPVEVGAERPATVVVQIGHLVSPSGPR